MTDPTIRERLRELADGAQQAHGWAREWPIAHGQASGACGPFIAAMMPDAVLDLLLELDTLERRAGAAEAWLDEIKAAFDATHLQHDVAYEDFAEVALRIFHERWRAAVEARSLIESSQGGRGVSRDGR